MPNINAARGFKVANTLGGGPFNGSINEYRIASGLAATICEGDLVVLLSTGYITRAAAGIVAGTGLPVGVFRGVRFVAADGLPKTDSKWIGGTATLGAADAVALVVDDPTVTLEAKFVGASSPTLAQIGENYDITDVAGSALTGLSAQGVDSASATVSAQKLRFLGFVKRPDNDTSAGNTQFALGLFAFASHHFKAAAGV